MKTPVAPEEHVQNLIKVVVVGDVMEILYLKQRCELKSYTGMFNVVV